MKRTSITFFLMLAIWPASAKPNQLFFSLCGNVPIIIEISEKDGISLKFIDPEQYNRKNNWDISKIKTGEIYLNGNPCKPARVKICPEETEQVC